MIIRLKMTKDTEEQTQQPVRVHPTFPTEEIPDFLKRAFPDVFEMIEHEHSDDLRLQIDTFNFVAAYDTLGSYLKDSLELMVSYLERFLIVDMFGPRHSLRHEWLEDALGPDNPFGKKYPEIYEQTKGTKLGRNQMQSVVSNALQITDILQEIGRELPAQLVSEAQQILTILRIPLKTVQHGERTIEIPDEDTPSQYDRMGIQERINVKNRVEKLAREVIAHVCSHPEPEVIH